jgi:hypothetical protein
MVWPTPIACIADGTTMRSSFSASISWNSIEVIAASQRAAGVT